MQLTLGVALDQFVQADAEHAGDQLQQAKSRTVTLGPEVGRQGLEHGAVRTTAAKRVGEGVGRVSSGQRRQDRPVRVQFPEQLHLAGDPFGRGGGGRADDDQAARGRQGGSHLGAQIVRGREFLAVAEDGRQPARRGADDRVTPHQAARQDIGLQPPMQAPSERGVLVVVADERAITRARVD